MTNVALIVGAGRGLSAAFTRRVCRQGMQAVVAARQPQHLEALCSESGARAVACDVTDAAQVVTLFDDVCQREGVPEVVLYNPSARVRGAVVELAPEEVAYALRVTAFGAFLVAQQAARRMLELGRGTILFTGASASVKGYANSSSFAMGKFALRGLAQSLARELAPQNIHVAHFVIDGGIANQRLKASQDEYLDADAIADTYWHVYQQPRSAWTWEVELRPWCERF